MLPEDFFAGLAGDVLSAFVNGLVAFFLVPLTALTSDLLTFLIALIPF